MKLSKYLVGTLACALVAGCCGQWDASAGRQFIHGS